MVGVTFKIGVTEGTSDELFCAKYRVRWSQMSSTLCCISNPSQKRSANNISRCLSVTKTYSHSSPGGSRSIPLAICNDFDKTTAKDSDAGVSCPQVNPDDCSVVLLRSLDGEHINKHSVNTQSIREREHGSLEWKTTAGKCQIYSPPATQVQREQMDFIISSNNEKTGYDRGVRRLHWKDLEVIRLCHIARCTALCRVINNHLLHPI
jgi:hypothetical protein